MIIENYFSLPLNGTEIKEILDENSSFFR